MNMVQSNDVNVGNFPLYVVEADAYYDCCTEEYYATAIPSELSSDYFVGLVKRLITAAYEHNVPMEIIEWEIKRISQYGTCVTVRFEVDVLGFLTLDYLSDDGETLFTIVKKPDSELTELFKRLQIYIIENQLMVE